MNKVIGVMPLWDDEKNSIWMLPGRKFLWAVQWHPEFSFRNDENSQRIFSAFIDSI